MANIPNRKPVDVNALGKKPINPSRGKPQTAKPRPKGQKRPPSSDVGEKTLIGDEIGKDKPSAAAPQQAEELDKASLKIISGGTVSNYRLKKEKIVTTVGSQREDCDIVVNDPAVANKQLAIIYYDGMYVLADCGVNDLASFDGVKARQIVCPIGTRCVINLNNTTLIFESEAIQRPPAGAPKPQKRFHLEMDEFGGAAPDATFTLNIAGREVRSTGEAIILGAHRDCDVTLKGENLRPYHALCHWNTDGIYVTKLSVGEVLVNNQPVEKSHPLLMGDEIDIAGHKMEIKMEGDVEGRCEALYSGYKVDFNYIRFTAIPGSVCRSFMLPAVGGAIMIGRSPHADVTLEDGAVSREHTQIIPNGKSCQVIDNYSANGCYVNNEKVTKARLRAGDLVEIGRSIFFMHYD